MDKSRRDFLKKSAIATGGLYMAATTPSLLFGRSNTFDFKISLAEWSLNKEIFSGELDNLNFPVVAKEKYGINAVEYVNQFFPDKAKDKEYLKELKSRSDASGVQNVLIMIDNEGFVAAVEDKVRNEAVENHYKWIEAAEYLGCHAIRINLFGSQEPEEDVKAWTIAAVEGLGKLAEFGSEHKVSVIVENHGGLSSHGGYLANVLKQIDSEWAGTLPDFGNFCIRKENDERWGEVCAEEYDVYKGVKDLMPYAKGVSAKTFNFDEDGNELNLDYMRLFKIIKESGFNGGYVGIEYEGDSLSADEGIRATKKLLEKVRAELS
ncbi:MAG: sugar phosphate isomerase/epimerase family protein [Gracilimonas sp.]